MTATQTQPRLGRDDVCLAFVKHMMKSEQQRGTDGVPLGKLTDQFSKPVLAAAFSRGLIELGQRKHSWTGPTPRTVIDERDPETGKPIAQHDENKQKLHVDKAMSFVQLKRHGSKPVTVIIADDAKLPDPLKYHVRLTNDGLAAAA